MRALRTFTGTEGNIRRGDIFEVDSKERAEALKSMQLADNAEDGAEITNFYQLNEQLDEKTKTELEEIAEAEGVKLKEDALKKDILKAIKQKRQFDYLRQAQSETAFGGLATMTQAERTARENAQEAAGEPEADTGANTTPDDTTADSEPADSTGGDDTTSGAE
nr:MAG TPA_asm: hypothetical protein [Caudoviricetes sp.]